MEWQQRLTQEKSLLAIYKTARVAAYSAFNVRTALVVFLLIVAGLGANAYFGASLTSSAALSTGVREIADIGLTFTTAILGFLISGFAIFAGISKPEVLISLAKVDHGKHQISELQFIFFNFMLVFIHFLAFLLACILIKSTTFADGPFGRTVVLLSEANRSLGLAFVSVAFAIMFSWLVFAALLLKSFIWNLYQAVLITILMEAAAREQADALRQAAAAKECGPVSQGAGDQS